MNIQERKLLGKILEYRYAVKQKNFDFTSELESKSVNKLEDVALLLNAFYTTSIANRYFSEEAPLEEATEVIGIIDEDTYDSPTEKLLDFVLQLRVQNKDAKFNFNQKNIIGLGA